MMTNYKINPAPHMVLIKERVVEAKTKGGIALPNHLIEGYQNAETEGEIVSVGIDTFSDWKENKPELGDIVYYQKYDGIGKKYNNINYRLLSDECIFAYSKNYIKTDEGLEVKLNAD